MGALTPLQRAMRAPPRSVALWGLEPDLAAYLARQLRAHWPDSDVVRVDADTAAADPEDARTLWVCGAPPRRWPTAPTLCFRGVAARPRLRRLRPGLWQCSLPVSGRSLARLLHQVWNDTV